MLLDRGGVCERLEITPRTMRRDVKRLRRLGYPVNSTSGPAGGYELGAGATLPRCCSMAKRPVGLRTAASGSVTGIEEASVRALAKLRQLLPRRLSRRVNAMHSFILPLENKGPSGDAQLLSTIAAACRHAESLRFSYRSQQGESTRRHGEPHRLVQTGRRRYLSAWITAAMTGGHFESTAFRFVCG